MPELSADAKKELAEAIRIVREDKQYSMLRDIHSRSGASGTGSTPPPNNPPNDPGITPPPPANPTQPPPEPQAKKDAYWGELLS